jgi:hypothetical protein
MITADSVYAILGLPQGLRLHHALTVALLMRLGSDLDGDLGTTIREAQVAMALHDLGNAVQLPEDDAQARAMLQEPADDLPKWRLHTAYMRSLYGNDDHQATAAILGHLRTRPAVVELIGRKSSKNFHMLLERDRPIELFALYADMRAAPAGVVSIAERHAEATRRYAGTARQGLGGTVGLADLEELERRVSALCGTDAAADDLSDVEHSLQGALDLDVADAFL